MTVKDRIRAFESLKQSSKTQTDLEPREKPLIRRRYTDRTPSESLDDQQVPTSPPLNSPSDASNEAAEIHFEILSEASEEPLSTILEPNSPETSQISELPVVREVRRLPEVQHVPNDQHIPEVRQISEIQQSPVFNDIPEAQQVVELPKISEIRQILKTKQIPRISQANPNNSGGIVYYNPVPYTSTETWLPYDSPLDMSILRAVLNGFPDLDEEDDSKSEGLILHTSITQPSTEAPSVNSEATTSKTKTSATSRNASSLQMTTRDTSLEDSPTIPTMYNKNPDKTHVEQPRKTSTSKQPPNPQPRSPSAVDPRIQPRSYSSQSTSAASIAPDAPPRGSSLRFTGRYQKALRGSKSVGDSPAKPRKKNKKKKVDPNGSVIFESVNGISLAMTEKDRASARKGVPIPRVMAAAEERIEYLSGRRNSDIDEETGAPPPPSFGPRSFSPRPVRQVKSPTSQDPASVFDDLQFQDFDSAYGEDTASPPPISTLPRNWRSRTESRIRTRSRFDDSSSDDEYAADAPCVALWRSQQPSRLSTSVPNGNTESRSLIRNMLRGMVGKRDKSTSPTAVRTKTE